MGFDYGYTCTIIDKDIDSIKSVLDNYLTDVIDEVSPKFEGDVRQDFINTYVDNIYQEISDHIESIRSSNSDIRDAAEKQIESIEERMQEMEEEKQELEERIDSLESDLSDANNLIDELQ